MITITHDCYGARVHSSHLDCHAPNWREAHRYAVGFEKPNYPMPAMIGPVYYYADQHAVEMIVTDCDETFDPRLCIAVMKSDGFVITDYPHDSPNYR